jgi:muramoyltetrapeptide carboxypeptidase
MLRQYIEKYHIPLVCGFPGGHDDINLPVVMGAPVTIDVRGDGATVSFGIEGNQYRVMVQDIVLDTVNSEQ